MRCAVWWALIGLDSMERIGASSHPSGSRYPLLTDTDLARTTGRWPVVSIIDVPAALEARGYHHEVGGFSPQSLEVSE